MLDIIIDTNILFSALLNKKSNISQIILNSKNRFLFYTPKFTLTELELHKNKILNITGFTDNQFDKLLDMFFDKVSTFDEEMIPEFQYDIAYNLCQDIDEDDLFFVALSNHLNAKLWTGDKKLITGLKEKGFSQIIETKEMLELYIARN